MKQSRQAVATALVPQFTPDTIGLDLGDRWSRYCVVDENGVVVAEDRIRTSATALQQRFKRLPARRIVLEAGTHSPWVSRLLESLGHRVVVANPRKVRLIYESDRKNDRLDARMLARLGRVDVSLLAPIQHRSAEAQADLAVVRGRDALVAARTQMINAVRGMVKTAGGRLPKSTTAAFSRKALPWIPPELRLAIAPLLESVRVLSEQIHLADRQITVLADEKYPETKLLRRHCQVSASQVKTAPRYGYRGRGRILDMVPSSLGYRLT
jgi:transposase